MAPRPRPPLPTIDEIVAELSAAGIDHVGVTTADVLADARQALHDRAARGLHDGMRFTYKNPDRSTDPRASMPEARSVIVAARPYLTETDPERPTGPQARVGRYAWVDHYAPLRAALRTVGAQIKAAGHRAVAYADDNSMVDRAIAHRAGLGWYGKNANLLLPGAGSFFVLGCLVTTAEYAPIATRVDDGCGSCVRCVDGCPTGAIIEPGVIDGARCLSWILQKPGSIPVEYREAIGDRIYGCDDCQDVCPISVRLGRRNTIELTDDAIAWADLAWLLEASDDAIEERHGRWYIADRDMRWLRRNALVVLGNVADPGSDTAARLLDRYRSADDPILAEHAAWAADQLARRRTGNAPPPR
ncbi:MAG: tRNA epoxyqueuosine(34) reductase QueG [Actinomycetota bacterium]